MGFMDNYEPVADRIAKFWEKYPNGRLHTEIVLINEQEIVIKASAFTDREDTRAASIDFAQETRNSSAMHKTSFLEICATSALGRCLATLNFQPKVDGKANRPSREEMSKAIPATQRNWASEATVLAGKKDVDGLRKLYSEAKNAKAPEDLLKSIEGMAKSLG